MGGAAAAAAMAAGPIGAPALAQTQVEIGQLVIAMQFGLAYLPLHVMKNQGLIDRQLARQGLPNTKVDWAQLGGGTAANDGLLSGTIHVVSGGVGPLLTIWDRTKGNAEVRGIATFDTTALYLTTINPNVRTLRDFTERDRIAMPAVKVSIQAVTLQMACEKEFGVGKHEQLDPLTVAMAHPDATAALLSGQSEVTAHFGSPPFQFQQLENPRVRKVLSSFDVLGGPTTFNSAYTTARMRSENPRTYRAFFDALVEAHDFIQKNRAQAVEIYIAEEKSRLTPAFINQMMDGDVKHTIVPRNTMGYADFLGRVGRLRNRPASWKDYYFPEVHEMQGS